jgi:hypothetical protein
MFMGDLTKDPRLTTTDPRTDQMAEQHRFRHERYIRGKLQNNTDSRMEGVIGPKRMVRQIKAGFGDLSTRLGDLFDDSFNNMAVSANPHPGNTIIRPQDAIQEDQAIYQVQDEMILPRYSTDIISKLRNLVGAKWQAVPDGRFGISSVSNVYRPKREVDRAANAVFRMGRQDTPFGITKEGMHVGAQSLPEDTLRMVQHTAGNGGVLLNADSKKQRAHGMPVPPTGTQSVVERFIDARKLRDHMVAPSVNFKYTPGTKRLETLVEPIKHTAIVGPRYKSQQPADNMQVAYKVDQSVPTTSRTEDVARAPGLNIRAISKAFVARNDPLQEQLFNGPNYQNVAYQYGAPSKDTKQVERTRLTKAKFAGDAAEMTAANQAASTVMPAPRGMYDFQFDTDPTINNMSQSRRGLVQRMTRMDRHQITDNTVSPVNDTIAPMRTRYPTNSS